MGDYSFEKKPRMDSCLETAVTFCFGRPTQALDVGAYVPSATFLFGVFFEKVIN